MVCYEGIEQSFVDVLKVAHEAVFLDRSHEARQPVSSARALLLQIADVRWKQSMQTERVTLSLRKRCAFVEPGIVEQLRSVEVNFHGTYFGWSVFVGRQKQCIAPVSWECFHG